MSLGPRAISAIFLTEEKGSILFVVVVVVIFILHTFGLVYPGVLTLPSAELIN